MKQSIYLSITVVIDASEGRVSTKNKSSAYFFSSYLKSGF
jgi:hypothetical protein